MSELSLTVRFPLQVYYGHLPDKSTDTAPSPARLHAALLSAASLGSLAEDGQPSSSALDALRWLEKNPPSELLQPETLLSGGFGRRFIYRSTSSIDRKSKRHVTEEREVSDGVAVQGRFGFKWSNIPEDIANTLSVLAEDIPHLGEAHSVAVVEREDFAPNLELSPEGGPFTLGSVGKQVAASGRTDELIRTFNAFHKRNPPTATKDRTKTKEAHSSYSPSPRCLTTAWYKAVEETSLENPMPWTEAFFFEIEREILPEHRVDVCTTMHRALVAHIGNDVSPMITGKYSREADLRPPNRLAIQYVPAEIASTLGFPSPVLALFAPNGASSQDLAQLRMASQITHLWSRQIGKVRIRWTGKSRSCSHFWKPPREGMQRFWKPLNPVIPETRPVKRTHACNREWTLADSGLLSLTYVWRDEADVHSQGQQKYWDLANWAAQKGARVLATKLITGRPRQYVHHSHRSVPLRPYTGVFDLGDLGTDRTAVMIGQSRHLGGGFLIPFDVPIDILEYKENAGA